MGSEADRQRGRRTGRRLALAAIFEADFGQRTPDAILERHLADTERDETAATLARELHDTVAHHVSAIAIRAQAGRVVARSDPAAALDALVVIEEEASRTLAEMRDLVGALRRGTEADLAPQRGVADIERLTDSSGPLPHVAVELSGDLEGLRPSLDATLYRLAQESITNAVRHARHATRIQVTVRGEPACVRLTVGDDGAVYVSVGSTGNASEEDRTADPERATVLRVPPGGGEPAVFARGVRNGTGLAVGPDGAVWSAVNNRDNIAYPYDRPHDGEGGSDLGEVLEDYACRICGGRGQP